MRAKYFYTLFLLAVMLISASGCKKFLSLDPTSDLSGNNFWRSKEDVEAFTNGNYQLLRTAVTRPNLQAEAGTDEFAYYLFTGDLRGAPVIRNTAWSRVYIDQLANNNLKAMMVNDGYWYGIWNIPRLTTWSEFYKVIASANIAFKEIDKVPDASLTDDMRKAYKAEAVFVRNFCYFNLVRQYGDVPYYIDAYDTGLKSRMNMVQVLKNCVADLDAVRNDLPWTYKNPVYVAVRAMRGSALALLMHLNMWLAGFDAPNAQSYYTKVTQYGSELLGNGGNYQLLPLERTGEIFKGRSKEGLFEIPQNKNYNESFGWGTYYDHTKKPDETSTAYPYIWYTKAFMEKVFPPSVADERTNFWYKASTIYLESSRFYITKFLISTADNSPDQNVFDASETVFRYSDALLLYAEALADLGRDDDAKALLNNPDPKIGVRARARATPISTTGDELKDDIYYERCRELMGEAHWWFDLVRTKRVINNPFGYKCTVSEFLAGCWTWPIDASVRKNNPHITPNTFWGQ